MKRSVLPLVLSATALLAGCSSDDAAPQPGPTPAAESQSAELAAPVEPVAFADRKVEEDQVRAPAEPAIGPVTPEQLEAAIKGKNPQFQGQVVTQLGPQGIAAVGLNDPAIEDISPLAGLPLSIVDLHDSHVTDLSALAGMQLMMIDLSNTGVSDIGVLKGMPLKAVFLERSRVDDISALSGAPLVEVAFSETPLEDIIALKGAPIQSLRLVDTKVRDLEPLRGGQLQMVWLNGTPVEDCSPLASNPVVSVTLAGTKISDISCFKGHPTLQRLHIAETEVTDLSPLQWMDGLTRLIFTPNRIKDGIQYARRMQSLREIGTAFGTDGDEGKMFPPNVFWQMYDEGKFN